jgi:hypothetical protein
MKWLYSIVLLILFAAVAVTYLLLVAHFLAPVVPVPHNVIHSGIGNALCTPSTVCTREF